ncbi:MAG: response regulator transcription factor [Dysgonamonadaceae bacterium]|jgi:DNA-binding NarL/FixJ family response regulator|nr:response regulator transcription factor [Dysgonamonadaceae bacterium]
MITVHITEDQKLMVELLSEAINASEIACMSGISYNIADCKESLAACTPDVLLLDLKLPDGNGIDFCTEVCRKYPQVKVIALTMYDNNSIVQRILHNGAKGFISKDSAKQEIIDGIEAVMEGEIYQSKAVLNHKTDDSIFLTNKEKEIVGLIIKGCIGPKIAKRLNIAPATVRTHVATIKRKLDASTWADVARIAMEKLLI